MIRSPHEVIEDPLATDIYPKLIAFKRIGYQKEYGEFVLPFDSSDFIASHVLLCEKQKTGDLIPVLGFKSVTLRRCDDFRIPFPMLGMLESKDNVNQESKDAVLKLMNHYRQNSLSEKFAYNGSFTIIPRLREDKVLMKHLWDITFSLITNYYIESGIDHVVAVCAMRFNVHKKKEELGWNTINGLNGPLSPYLCRSLFDTQFLPMELVGVKEKSEVPSSKFKDLWENKIVIDRNSLKDHLKIAA